jgi:glycosyltransferase involved in cell wall biosynthesis
MSEPNLNVVNKPKGKILYMTDHNRGTGFGKVGDNVCKALASAGYEVYFLGWGFHASEPMQRENYMMLPCGNGSFGEDILGNYIMGIRPDILITQADTRMVAYVPELLKQLPYKPTWLFYPVIDGSVWDVKSTNSKWPSNWTEIIKSADKVIAMTNYGRDIMTANGITSTTIYHGVNTDMYKPLPEEARKQVRLNAGLPEDGFIVSGVFKNMQRKNPQQYLQAFKIFLDKVPEKEREKCILLLHTNPKPSGPFEVDLTQHAKDYDIPQKNVAFSSGILPPNNMPLLYQVSDVYLQLGGMEGFCLPLAEAISCGIPIVAIDSSTHKELLAGTGLVSKCPTFKGHLNAKVTYGSYNGVECDIANPWDVADKIFELYNNKALRSELGIKATERALKVFDLSVVNKQWIDTIASMIVTEEQIPDEWKKLYEETKV